MENKEKIVFVNGCFDLLHSGHVSLLKYCRYLAGPKSEGGKVIVGLNSDSSIKRLKGPKRPIISEDNRMFLLRELDVVDEVLLFYEDTPINLIKRIKPDVIVKGIDYKGKESEVVGSDIAPVMITPEFWTVPECSTSKIIEKIKSL